MRIGVCIHYEEKDSDLLAKLKVAAAHGLDQFQLVSWSPALWTQENVAYVKRLRTEEDVKGALRQALAQRLAVGPTALNLSTQPSVVLFIGVNGVGKTTSIGKIAHVLKEQGKKVLLCAGDTFRAAAADQLEIWAQRAGVDIVRQHEGADPGAVLFDALQSAKAKNVDVVLVDTAGRLHNKQNLMNELSKMRKIIDRECPDAAKETLLVLMRSRYVSVSLTTVTTDEDFEKLLLDENQREFYSEGRRWFDIKRLAIRRHGYVSFTDYSSKDFPAWIRTVYPGNDSYTIDGWNDRHQLMYWPVPQSERDKSGGALTQNPGYAQ